MAGEARIHGVNPQGPHALAVEHCEDRVAPDELARLGDVLLRHPHVLVLCDGIYDRIWFADAPVRSIGSVVPDLFERTLVINGVSTSHAMTGWRIGYGVGPAPLVAAINKLQSQMSSCPSAISQAAAAEALTSDRSGVEATVALYRARRDRAVALINAIPGRHCRVPDGAFHLFPGCAGLIGRTRPDGKRIETDLDVVLHLLETEGVASVHGGAYGMEPHFRISTATSTGIIEAACARIARAVAALA